MNALILLSEFLETQIELWKPLKRFPGYEVSSLGRVRSFRKQCSDGNTFWTVFMDEPQQFMSQCYDKRGYPRVGLRVEGRLQPKVTVVHRLVAETFLPNPENKPQVNHKSAVKTDNRVGNLEWTTRSENMRHAFDADLFTVRRGSANGWAKLDEVAVKEIKRLSRTGVQGATIARRFNVNKTTVSRILLGRVWTHVL